MHGFLMYAYHRGSHPYGSMHFKTMMLVLFRYLPVAKVAWQDIKGTQVLVGNYEESVKMMGDTNFLNALINFPKEAITDETVELLSPYFKAQDFNFESAKKVNSSAVCPSGTPEQHMSPSSSIDNTSMSMCRVLEQAECPLPPSKISIMDLW